MDSGLRKVIFGVYAILAVLSVYFCFQLKFSFDFEQFFPTGDPDLVFFKDFIEDFGADDNFLLVAVERKEGVFEQDFLEKFHDFTLKTRDLDHVVESQSLTKISYPLKTPFTITTIPAIHIDKPSKYAKDRERILKDERFVYNFINPDGTALVVLLKTVNSIQLTQAEELMNDLVPLLESYQFDDYHLMGRAHFQKELVAMQKREITVSALVSGFLVCLIMFLIFRQPMGILISLVSIGLGMLLFLGSLGASGRELNAMAALYPVLMIIVGTSDVIHIMSKYIDEQRKGISRKDAIRTTVKEIGLATLLTSITTSVGFATLLTSRIIPIRDFGINSAIGVLIAYITVITFTTAAMSMYDADDLIKRGKGQVFWDNLMTKMYTLTKNNPIRVALGAFAFLLVCLLGISMITTNYTIIKNMPNGKKITADFRYFEKNFTGFRPLEFAVFAEGDYKADDYEVLKEIDKVEQHLHTFPPIKAISSATAIYKSINQMHKNNKLEAYQLPKDKKTFDKYKKLADKVPQQNVDILISKDKKKARISSRILDMGADTVQGTGKDIDQWITKNTNPNVATFRRTGTGLIIDKNAEYVRRNLIQGLGLAILIVSTMMALLFRNIRMLLISLIPNVFPLLVAGAMLGFMGIELEAGVSIVFAIVFGIAVDDTIHFLSKYKLARSAGKTIDDALLVTFTETGKAICLTSIILFFGFLVMLFSIHPPSVTIGCLISVTLFSALFSDLLLIPILIRWLMKE